MGLKATGATRKQHRPGSKGSRSIGAGGGKPAGRRSPAPQRRAPGRATVAAPLDRPAGAQDMCTAVCATVAGLRYDLIDVERAPRGLLRVTIDRRPDQAYTSPGDAITVDDCETVTRQLQYALEVDGIDYARLEVSSPGLDRPLRTEADYQRFCGQAVNLTLKVPFRGRKQFQGPLGRTSAGWQLTFVEGSKEQGEQVLSFAIDEVREARLVPVVDFKGRQSPGVASRDSKNDEGSK